MAADTAPGASKYWLSADGLRWEARGYASIPPGGAPPAPTVGPFILGDAGSVLNSVTRVLV